MAVQKTYGDWPFSGRWHGATDDHLRQLGLPVSSSVKQQAARRAVVTEAIIAGRIGLDISYSRRSGDYSIPSRYAPFGIRHTHTLNAVLMLASQGLIEEQRSHPGASGRRSTMRASEDLLSATSDWSGFRFAVGETIRLKDAQKALMDYADTSQTFSWRNEVDVANQAFSHARLEFPGANMRSDVVKVGDEVVLPALRQGYRVFNDARLDHGGRFYGKFWDGLTKKSRSLIQIDGDRVEEPDFACLHPRLIGAMTGWPLVGDAYDVAGYDRKDIKRALNIAFNANSRSQAIRALADVLGGRHMCRIAQDMLEAVSARHAGWTRCFYTRVGLELQYLDSELMFSVLLDCFNEGFCALPVHDSFIVQARNEDRVRGLMEGRLAALLQKLRDAA